MTIELIDTLWNVNYYQNRFKDENGNELIDTLWNVNIKNCGLKDLALRINRYIMECK